MGEYSAVEQLRWERFAKIVNGYFHKTFIAISTKCSTLYIFQCSEYASPVPK